MALFSMEGNDIPKGYVSVDREEAVNFQLGLIETLSPITDSWCVRYGPVISSISVGATAIYFHNYFRTCVNVKNFRRFHTYIPAVFIPTVFSNVTHTALVRDDIIIQKWSCPTCYHIKSTLLQTLWGIFCPLVASSISAFAYARRYNFTEIPALNDTKNIFKFFKDKMKPINRTVTSIALGQILLGMILAELEAKQNNHFNLNIHALKDAYDNAQQQNDD